MSRCELFVEEVYGGVGRGASSCVDSGDCDLRAAQVQTEFNVPHTALTSELQTQCPTMLHSGIRCVHHFLIICCENVKCVGVGGGAMRGRGCGSVSAGDSVSQWDWLVGMNDRVKDIRAPVLSIQPLQLALRVTTFHKPTDDTNAIRC